MPYGIGQVSTLEMRRIGTLEEAAGWQRKMQETVMRQSPHHIPAIFHMEGLCGAFIQEGTSFPSGIARGSGWDPELEEKIAKVVAKQEAACGITHILAPVLDISRDSRMGRQGETYGEDPALAADSGNGIYERNPDNRGRRQKTGKCGQAFSRISQFTGWYPRDKQRYAVPPHGRNIRQAFPVCDF